MMRAHYHAMRRQQVFIPWRAVAAGVLDPTRKLLDDNGLSSPRRRGDLQQRC